jgi:butyryl-CoA dehydrogenase
MSPETVALSASPAFDLTEDQIAVREIGARLRRERDPPDRDADRRDHEFPLATTKKMGELGLHRHVRARAIRRRRHGLHLVRDRDRGAVARVREPRRDRLGHNSLVCYPILTYGNEAQKQKYLTQLAKGEWIGAYCLTEPNAGSNAANQQTTAVLDGDHYVLNGTKLFVTNAGRPTCSWSTPPPTARSGPRASRRSSSSADTPGVNKGKKEEKLGIHASDTREIAFAERRVPKENLWGSSTRATAVGAATLGGGAASASPPGARHRAGSLEARCANAGRARQFDAQIGEFDAIREMLANSGDRGRWTARGSTYQAAVAARARDRPHVKVGRRSPSGTPPRRRRAAPNWACPGGHGGYGFSPSSKVERFWRDARICEIYEGTTEVQKMVVAAQVLKEHAVDACAMNRSTEEDR